jgi:hypothetical protein
MDASSKTRQHVNEEPTPYVRRVVVTAAETDSRLGVSPLP